MVIHKMASFLMLKLLENYNDDHPAALIQLYNVSDKRNVPQVFAVFIFTPSFFSITSFPMSKSNETIVGKNSTLLSNQQTTTTYKNQFLLLSSNDDSGSSSHISPAIRDSYIQQNLPIRRQSLIVYRDKLRSEKKVPKSARDLTLPLRRRHVTIIPTQNKEPLSETIDNDLTWKNQKHSLPSSPPAGKLRPKIPLSIHIAQHNAIELITEPNTATSHKASVKQQQQNNYDQPSSLFNLTLEGEKNNTELAVKQPPNLKSIELIQPNKPALNDVDSQYDKQDIDQQYAQNNYNGHTHALTQMWNGLPSPPPLARLRSVFSRLQPNMSNGNSGSDSHLSDSMIGSLRVAKRAGQQNNQTRREHKKTYSAALISVYKRKNTMVHESTIYTALLSHVANELVKKIELSTIDRRDKIHFYHVVFSGTEAVDSILDIIQSTDRQLALIIGKALESQGLFHHVTYDCKLTDTSNELYQFQYSEQDESSSYLYRLPIPSQFLPLSLIAVSANDHNLLSSEKNGKKSVPSTCRTMPVNGVFSFLTDCYSPTCSSKRPCYSITCPRKATKEAKHQRYPSDTSLAKITSEPNRALWRQSVPRNILNGTNLMEQKRQECIYELIYTEQDFCRDLQYVENCWIKPLLFSDIIPAERRDVLIKDIFWNWVDIKEISLDLSKDLTLRQEKYSIIPYISDIMARHVRGFEPFLTYGAHQTIGKHYYELEKKRNAKFAQFVQRLQRKPESRRLELHGYLTKPTSRLGRYNLLLNAIIEATPNNHPDHIEIPKVMAKITELLVQLNKKVGLSDNAFYLEKISSRIISTKGHDLRLTEPNRQLLLQGKLKRASQQYSRNNSTVPASIVDSPSSVDIQLFLFDHLLIFCKIKKQDGIECYKLFRKPIPLKFLSVFIPKTILVPSTKSNIYNRLSSSSTAHQISVSDIKYNSNASLRLNKYPISFQDNDDSSGMMQPPTTLIAPSEYMRKVWIDKIHEQQKLVFKEVDRSSISDSSSSSTSITIE
ncbi:hypothetical protein BDF20DRAFT_986387 [Mycotypha africana]|uniref:uncharacterized protein n=1 Tax=Mycotypha africana TaxID=64632 RepID=UPI0023015EF1|nr:uncharacterized protein BDF20DRAFT_986387 [Mycotypha africana]KAI8984512.1 hypothetical protein BDF20DRAFT_986387 [Mycotypha africana]